MQLFRRRPLCLFCFLFVVSTLLAIKLSLEAKLLIICAVIVAILVIAIYLFAIKSFRYRLLYCLLALVFVGGGMLSSAVGIDIPQRQAADCIGEHPVKMTVLNEEYSSEYSSAYVVRIEKIGDKDTSLKAIFFEDFENELYVGDTVYLNARLMPMDSMVYGIDAQNLVLDDDVLLCCIADDSESGVVKHFDREAPLYKKLFSRNGALVVLSELREGISDRATRLLGEETGALACGFLIGDTSEMSEVTIRDFRRAGVSHILAVSGMHISIILAVVEFLFRKLYLPKSVRIITVSILALVLLCLTGFSMSALRAVLMLLISYMIFTVSEEADAPTVLFVSVFIMLLLVPYSVYDVGMWMSFLATLGLVTVYPLAIEKLSKPRAKKAFVRLLLSIARGILMTALITVVANMFLLYIMCTVFGEMSLSAIPANIILSPLSTVFMIISALSVALGNIPILGDTLCLICQLLGRAITSVSALFSNFEWSVVSLRPMYARLLIIAFSVALAVLLVIKVKNKWVFAVVPSAFALIFCGCFFIRTLTFEPYATYTYKNGSETVCVFGANNFSIIDTSDGSFEQYSEMLNDAADNGATEIDSIVLTDVTHRHISTLEYVLKHKTVRNILIPYSTADEKIDASLELAELARTCGVKVSIYGDETVYLFDGVYFCADRDACSFAIARGKYMIAYCGVGNISDKCSCGIYASSADVVVFGDCGGNIEEYSYDTKSGASVIYSSSELFSAQKGYVEIDNTYVNVYDKLKIKLKFK